MSEGGETGKQRSLGAGAYGRLGLHFYDAGVLGLSSLLLWRCPSSRVLAQYQANVSANHLDVGVGTGYFLDKVEFPAPAPRLGLLDLNGNSLTHTARRLIRYAPEMYRADVLQPITTQIEPFDSIGLNYLLHCLPGPMESKAVAFDNLRPLLRPGGTLFGGTVLRHGISLTPQARLWIAAYNAMGIFGNARDSLDDLRASLEARFADVEIATQGCVALFRATAVA
ncbi:MAG: class I SAM-dependent methyltransferase [Candidatus Limnocylindrales bacterium]